MIPGTPVVPRNITVHLGAPKNSARNVTLPFKEYVKNVASSEIYPTWVGYPYRRSYMAG